VGLVRKSADEIRVTMYFRSVGVKEINELVLASNKLSNTFADVYKCSRAGCGRRAASWTTPVHRKQGISDQGAEIADHSKRVKG
jgi:hypothetical protein